jgi:hypothetical protein
MKLLHPAIAFLVATSMAKSAQAWPPEVYGDLLVCPFTADQPGHMRMVCVQEASNLVIEDHTSLLPGDTPRVLRDPLPGSVP